MTATVIAGMVATLVVPFGLGQWVPMPDGGPARWQGLSWAAGTALLILGLYALTNVGMPAHVAAWVVAVCGGVGAAVGLWRLRRTGLAALAHPAPVLAALVAVLALAHAGGHYIIYAWDEWTNWIIWARDIVLFDRVSDPAMVLAVRGDTPGWALMMAFPSLLAGEFRAMPAVVAGAALHIGLLGVVYDLAFAACLGVGGLGERAARTLSWGWLAALMAVEVSWRLVPTLLLVDEPQVWLMGSVTLLALYLVAHRGDRMVVAALVGLLGAAAYTVKISYLTLLPAVALMAVVAAMAERRDGASWRRAATVAAAAVLPFLLVKASWAGFAGADRCAAHLGTMLGSILAANSHYGEAPLAFLLRMLAGFAALLEAWKLPLTVAAAAGVLVAFGNRLTAVSALGLLAFVGLNFAGAYGLMSTCFTADEYAKLESFERYMRVPVRVVHLLGCSYLGLAALTVIRRRPIPAALGPWLMPAGVAVLLVAFQGWQGQRSYVEVTRRVSQPVATLDRLARARALAPAVARSLADRHLPRGQVLVVSQADADPVMPAANYEALGHRRGETRVQFLSLPTKPQRVAATLAEQGNRTVAVWLFDDGDAVRRAIGGSLLSACPPPGPGSVLLIAGPGGSECLDLR